MKGQLVAVCISANKGEPKQPVERALLVAHHGLQGDAHAGTWHRQVRLLAQEQVDTLVGEPEGGARAA